MKLITTIKFNSITSALFSGIHTEGTPCSEWHRKEKDNINVTQIKQATNLDDDSLISLLFQDVICRKCVHLLTDALGDGRDEGQRVQIKVITEDLGKLLRGDDALIPVPGECVSELLTVDLHVKANGDQDLISIGVFVCRCWVEVIEAVIYPTRYCLFHMILHSQIFYFIYVKEIT